MIANALLIAVLAVAGPDVDALRRELDAVAGRIEQLKEQRLAGEDVEDQLERLLVRSQELAEEIERARPEPPAVAAPAEGDPGRELADELRERAAALREQAAQLAVEAAQVDWELAQVLRSASEPRASSSPATLLSREPQAMLTPTALQAETSTPAHPELRTLLEKREDLEARMRGLQAKASLLDAAADALERGGSN
jgi:uncharacterized coiled-coil DUF342 family protein